MLVFLLRELSNFTSNEFFLRERERESLHVEKTYGSLSNVRQLFQNFFLDFQEREREFDVVKAMNSLGISLSLRKTQSVHSLMNVRTGHVDIDRSC